MHNYTYITRCQKELRRHRWCRKSSVNGMTRGASGARGGGETCSSRACISLHRARRFRRAEGVSSGGVWIREIYSSPRHCARVRDTRDTRQVVRRVRLVDSGGPRKLTGIDKSDRIAICYPYVLDCVNVRSFPSPSSSNSLRKSS